MTLKVPDSFVPDIAQEAITEGIAGAIVLYNSPAVILRNDLPRNMQMVDGDKIKVEYYGMVPPYQRNVPQATGLDAVKNTMSTEEAPAYQHGLRVDWSKWYQCLEAGKRSDEHAGGIEDALRQSRDGQPGDDAADAQCRVDQPGETGATLGGRQHRASGLHTAEDDPDAELRRHQHEEHRGPQRPRTRSTA